MPQGGTGFIEVSEPEEPLGMELLTNPTNSAEYILETCDAGKPFISPVVSRPHNS
jgi:hypothetical protein